MAGYRHESIRRLYAASIPDVGEELMLDEEARHHLRVLRLKSGEELILFDGKGAVARVELLDRQRVRVRTRDILDLSSSSKLILIQSLCKAHTLDTVVRMATELNVSAVYFVTTQRSFSTSKSIEKSMIRWNRIAREAARQSERITLPTLVLPQPLFEVLRFIPPCATRWICHARGESSASQKAKENWVAVGPEGGFELAEVKELQEHGFRQLSLGSTILRVDTAVAAALSLVNR